MMVSGQNKEEELVYLILQLTVDIKHTFCPSGIKAVDTPVLLYKRVEAGKYELACKLRDKQR